MNKYTYLNFEDENSITNYIKENIDTLVKDAN